MSAHESLQQKQIWDLPIRLFHWSLAILLVLQFGTAKFGWLDMQWHFRFGYALLALLLFRLLWGIAGSDNVRLRALFVSPRRVLGYLRGWRQAPVHQLAGHNPIGGWATVLILSVLLLQAISGLATSDDIEWFGPLCAHLPAIWIERASWLHHRMEPVILFLIAAHVLAVLQYQLMKGENLTASMLHGQRALSVAAPRLTGNRLAAVLLVVSITLIALLVWWLQ
jgi:cytochrome b